MKKNLLPKHHSQLSSRHYNTIYNSDLQAHNQNRKTLLKNKYHSSSLGAPIPLRSAPRNTIGLQHTTVEHIALMYQFQCTKCLNTCKTQYHSINKEEKKSPGTLSYIARADREWFHAKATTPKTVARASLLLSATKPPFTRKNNVSCKS